MQTATSVVLARRVPARWRPALTFFVAVAVYLGLEGLPFLPLLLLIAIPALAPMARFRVPVLVAAGAVALHLALVVATLAPHGDAALRLGALATALAASAALFVGLGTGPLLLAWWRALLARLPQGVPSPRLERAHGVAFVVAAAMLPVGEGAAFGGAALMLAAVVARRRAVAWRELASEPFASVIGCFLLFVLAGAAAWVLGGRGVLRPGELGRIGPLVVAPLFFLAAASLPRRWTGRAAAAFVVVLTLSAAAALAQYLFDLDAAEELRRFSVFSLRKQSTVPGSDRAVAGGFFFHRLKLAHVLLAGIGVLLARQVAGSPTRRRRALELIVLAVLAAALLFTFSRAAVLALPAAAVVCLFRAGGRWRRVAVLGALLLTVVVAAHPALRERLTSATERTALSDRAAIWREAVRLIDDNPLGVGLANYRPITRELYAALPGGELLPRTYAHDMTLSAWAETGPLGLFAFVAMWTLLAAAFWRGAHGSEAAAALAGLFIVVAFWLVGATHDVLFHKPVALTFWACVAVTAARLRSTEYNQAP